jgi:phosphohistidine phosphatase SixA
MHKFCVLKFNDYTDLTLSKSSAPQLKQLNVHLSKILISGLRRTQHCMRIKTAHTSFFPSAVHETQIILIVQSATHSNSYEDNV